MSEPGSFHTEGRAGVTMENPAFEPVLSCLKSFMIDFFCFTDFGADPSGAAASDGDLWI